MKKIMVKLSLFIEIIIQHKSTFTSTPVRIQSYIFAVIINSNSQSSMTVWYYCLHILLFIIYIIDKYDLYIRPNNLHTYIQLHKIPLTH